MACNDSPTLSEAAPIVVAVIETTASATKMHKMKRVFLLVSRVWISSLAVVSSILTILNSHQRWWHSGLGKGKFLGYTLPLLLAIELLDKFLMYGTRVNIMEEVRVKPLGII